MNEEVKTAHSALIAEIRKLQKEDGLTLAQITRESGIAKSTVSQFLSGQYGGNNEKIAEQAQKWLDTYKARHQLNGKLRTEPEFILLPSSKQWVQLFEYAQMAGDIGVITGAPGTSKTVTAEYYCKTNSNAWMVTASSSLRSPRALLEEIAEIIDSPVKSGSGVMRGLIKRLRNTGGLLIIDEAQHLSTESLDQLRGLNDQAGIGLAWIGNEPLRGRIEGMGQSKSNAQIFSRVGMWKARTKPLKTDLEQLKDAWGVTNPELDKLLFWIGSREGGLRELSKTLRFAYFIAGSEGRTELQASDIEAGWTQRKSSSLPNSLHRH
ncbi:AAA family ATPase [Aristophania vespae]|uniref:AAA family ATPase n=1 Tax=Aristophania vespae TaxID=2697033 RepID=UPI0023519366|nr:AAA family ATPase [Aristophania vespae]UMM63791.1 hypothetical protein DM15PD_07680 [Aristophania vespae]